jgi:hypothetical protein
MKTLSPEQIKLLKDPLPVEAISPHPTKKYLSTIKAIYVVERLNDVFGVGGWEVKNEVVETTDKWVVVKSRFDAREYGICIIDIFGGNDNADRGDAYKGACTDALTKIGSYLGIGMDIFKGLAPKASLYNHKELGDKPLITNGAFKKAMERIKAGEEGIAEKVISNYSLDPTQLSLIKSTMNGKS